MAKLTLSDAARVTGVSRMLLYRYIKAGKLSRTPDGLIDTTELLRAGLPLLHPGQKSDNGPLHDVTPPSVTPETSVTSHGTSTVTPPVTPAVTAETRTLERLIDVLQRELDAARERETLLLQMLSQMQQQNQRLLDMPRSPFPPATPQDAPGPAPPPSQVQQRPPLPPSQPQAPSGAPRGEMRRRIVALLQDHPEGLTPTQMQALLGVERRLADTCLGMLRAGLVHRVRYGRYGAGPPPAFPANYTP